MREMWKNAWSGRWSSYNNALRDGTSPKHESCLQPDGGKNEEERNISMCKTHIKHETSLATLEFEGEKWS